MSSDAFDQFAEQPNQWVLDHGISSYRGGGFKKGVGNADVDLPKLQSAIRDLIAEARAGVAADAINQIGHVLAGLDSPEHHRRLTELRDELAEVAEPGAAIRILDDVGSRKILQHVLGDLQRRVARLERRQGIPYDGPQRPDDDSLMGPSL